MMSFSPNNVPLATFLFAVVAAFCYVLSSLHVVSLSAVCVSPRFASVGDGECDEAGSQKTKDEKFLTVFINGTTFSAQVAYVQLFSRWSHAYIF